MHASNVVETCDSTNASTSQDDSELSSPVPHTTPPSTPPRGRTRYPDSLARVPLHRRGTSKTYERLEDLLREAGYKETRVFTPESERHNDHTTDRHASSVRGGVGAVVGFLAGLVSRNSSMAREPTSNKDSLSPRSQPPSPLAHIKALHPSSSTSQSASSYSFNTSPESLRKHSRFHATHAQRNVFPETHGQPRPPNSHYMRHQSSSNFSRDAPNAHAYLRHMASAPNIQPLAKRPSSSNVSLRSHRNPQPRPRPSRRSLLLSADDIIETDDPPPLPSNWMESVAKALLSGVVPDTASTRKTSSTFSDATNKPREQRRPPLLCAQVREQRASRIEGKVSQTNVTCRSAPASRAGSRVRRTGAEDEGSGHRRDDERRRKNKRDEESRKGKGKRKESDMVPSLARTRVENDEWSMSRYLPASYRQQGPSSSSSSSEDMDDDEEEEDEGELDLERLLVPARRQASIRSLRKHLHPPITTGSLRGLPPTSPSITTASTSTINGQLSPFAPDSRQHIWLDDSWGTGRSRRWVVGEEDDEGDGYGNGAFSASETGSGTSTRTRAGMKRRRGLPGAWAQWGG